MNTDAPKRLAPSASGELQDGDAVVFIDGKERLYLRVLQRQANISVRDGTFSCDSLIGLPEGSRVFSSRREAFLLFRPTYAQLIPSLPRRAQVIYPKDVGPILLWGDIYPGARVVEVGAGPGALTIALLRAVGPQGRVTSYENRPDFAAMARENVARFFGAAPHWELKLADATSGITERSVDRLILDIPEPWNLLSEVTPAVRPGAVVLGYLPTVLQVKQFVDALRRERRFANPQVMETLIRFWHLEGLSVRPEHRMVAHTGFITIARRRADTSRAP